MNLVFNCHLVITDSGGIQEETTYLGIPCLRVRPNAERPIRVTQGTNQLCTLNDLQLKVNKILAQETQEPKRIEFWDGNTVIRIVDHLEEIMPNKLFLLTRLLGEK